ncbi:hypothetical protein [Amycolatopsis magusensis]|uniref:Uncharacterized protein n=1 Tax=Amycolatopsis magusensis TaxID=882444 RepID=A0ABS4Q1F6_9PSEU|nr:hypothetical protein [Amycolatopsis magusensis]MBP2185502.1 hypothetical protein [Amycolatopsis magusensis]MDI5976476.1 hypothetical protein [Amycolatopsis magusensis]
MDSADARAALHLIRQRERQVAEEASRAWPSRWLIPATAAAAGVMLASGDFRGVPGVFWGSLVAGTLVFAGVFVVAARRARAVGVVYRPRFPGRLFAVWAGGAAAMIAVGMGGPPLARALGVPWPYTLSGFVLAAGMVVTAVATTRLTRVPRD